MPEVFISYAHADDQPLAEGTTGWVTALADRLKKSLAMKRNGGQVTVWMDHRLEPQKQVDAALADRVARADCFVAVLSPRYLESPWCRREMETFVGHTGEDGARVFLVELMPTARDEWPQGVRSLSTLQFWTQAFEDPAAIPLGWPVPDPAGDRPYWRAVNELSHFVSERLQTPGRRIEESPGRCVWIADPTDHVLEFWERLVGALRQHGCRVSPAAPGAYPAGSEAEYRAALDRDLSSADVMVQLLGPHPGRRPLWSDTPFTLLQADAARAAVSDRAHALSLWRLPDVRLDAISDAAYAQLLTGAAAGGFEDFQRQLILRLSAAPTASAPSGAQAHAIAGATESPLTICVSADGPDRLLGQRVRDILFDLGADANLTPEPAPDQPPALWRRDYETLLGDSHGVVFVYGSTPASWVQAQVQAARKLLARSRRGVWGALLDGPPGAQPDHGVRSHSILNLDCRGGIAREPLAQFLNVLRTGNSTAGAAHA